MDTNNIVRMELVGKGINTMINDFDISNENGKWIAKPKVKPSYEKFQLIRKVMTSHGGKCVHGISFAFNEDPTSWLSTTELSTPKPPVIVEDIPKKETTKKPTTSSKKSTSKKSAKTQKEVPAIEYEIYTPEAVNVCVEHLLGLVDSHSKPEDDPSHAMLLRMLIDECSNDEELRANLTHKDYDKVLNNAACEWGKEQFEKDKNFKGGECSPATILPYVLKEYKKPVVKKTTVETALNAKGDK